MNALQRLIQSQANPRPLALLRVVAGVNAILCGWEAWGKLVPIVEPGGLRVPFDVGFPVFAQAWLTPFMTIWFGAVACLVAGCCTRCAGALLAGQMIYVLLIDQQAYSNHLYLVALEVFFLTLGNAGACWSLDASWRGTTQAVPAWPITLWKAQISIVYFFAAASKLNPTFCGGDVLAMYWPTTGPLGFLADWRTPMLLQPLSIAAVAAEFFLTAALWSRALRRLALVVGIGLHVGMIGLLAPIDPMGVVVFALASLPPYLLFFDWPQRWSGES